MSVSASIANISRGSLHDGPGVRTVVYFKGCGLRCAWCHNPETFSAAKQVLYASSQCIHCGRCVEICPEHHTVHGNDMIFRRDGCTSCGNCVKACPSLALRLCGEEMSVDDLFAQLKKDLHYYRASGGGVTFSGGECLLHPRFVAKIAEKCKAENIHTAVESAFFVPWENVEQVLPFVDLFFADLKIPDPQKHRKFTGQDNRLIIDNISRLSEIHNNIILRIPVIPGVNDRDDDIDGFANIIRTFGKGVKGIELLKYNNLAESKYESAGETYAGFADDPQTDAEMQKLCNALTEKCDRNCYFV